MWDSSSYRAAIELSPSYHCDTVPPCPDTGLFIRWDGSLTGPFSAGGKLLQLQKLRRGSSSAGIQEAVPR